MDFPVLHDPMNKLGIKVVPVFIAIDEHGIVRSTRPNARTFEKDFIDKTFPAPDQPAAKIDKSKWTPEYLASQAANDNNVDALINLGDSHLIFDKRPNIAKVIDYYQRAKESDSSRPDAYFRLGVGFRMRYDNETRQSGDFAKASQHWTDALSMDPNHYIWRRRIQQYGPRMDKPYPFYNWVEQARKEIVARGEQPVQLDAEPRGTELAEPARRFDSVTGQTNPDPDGKITLDVEGLINASVAAVPAKANAGSSVRVHVTLQPANNSKWNNEAGQSIVWINDTNGLKLSKQSIEMEQPKEIETRETRSIEFEVAIPEDAKDKVTVSGYALYYVCEETNGQCLYRRQNFEIEIPVTEPRPRRRGR